MRYFKSFPAQLALYVLGMIALPWLLCRAGMSINAALEVCQFLNLQMMLLVSVYFLGEINASLRMNALRLHCKKDEGS